MLKIFDVCFLIEDKNVEVNNSNVIDFKYIDYLLVENGMSEVVEDLENEIEKDVEIIKGYDKNKVGEFLEGVKKLKELKEMFGGVILSWGVEYDFSLSLVYFEDNKNENEVLKELENCCEVFED